LATTMKKWSMSLSLNDGWFDTILIWGYKLENLPYDKSSRMLIAHMVFTLDRLSLYAAAGQ
jgi:hypothetical protein